ncbi:MAG: hypothetical protein ACOC5R_00180 [Elusimicrobiota bacterium]
MREKVVLIGVITHEEAVARKKKYLFKAMCDGRIFVKWSMCRQQACNIS